MCDMVRFAELANENLHRNWQNGVLWINDPDVVLLQNRKKVSIDPTGKEIVSMGTVQKEEFLFCAAYVRASGGMVLSGDDLVELSSENVAYLQKMLPSIGKAAEFDGAYEVGNIKIDEYNREIYLFNAGETQREFQVELGGDSCVTDFWTGAAICKKQKQIIVNLSPHSAKILCCRNSFKK